MHMARFHSAGTTMKGSFSVGCGFKEPKIGYRNRTTTTKQRLDLLPRPSFNHRQETQLPPAFGRRSSDLSGTNSTIRNNMNMRRSRVLEVGSLRLPLSW